MPRMRQVRHARRQGLLPLPLPDLNPLASPLLTNTTSIPLPLPSILTNSSSSFSATPSSNSSAPASSTSPTPPPPSTTSSSSSSSSRSSPTPTTPTPSPATSVYVITSSGTVHTVTEFVNAPPSAIPSPPAATQGFLQNKPLSGSIFGLLGLIGLFAIISIVMFGVRRRRRGHLLKEAISFDPATTFDVERHYGDEKGSGSFGRRTPSFRSKDDYGYYPGPGGYDQPPLQNDAVVVQLPNMPSRAFAPHANDMPPVRSGNSQRFALRH